MSVLAVWHHDTLRVSHQVFHLQRVLQLWSCWPACCRYTETAITVTSGLLTSITRFAVQVASPVLLASKPNDSIGSACASAFSGSMKMCLAPV